MIAMYRGGATQAMVAKRFKITQQSVSAIFKRFGVKTRTHAYDQRM